MPKISIKVFAYLKEEFGTREIVFTTEDGATIKNVLEKLGETYGVSNAIFDAVTGEIQRRIALLLNGNAVSRLPDGLNTMIRDGDVLVLLPPMVGG